ncbi:MAG: ABC transporter permease [Lewinellaceae bacterium]|nr:ABC transporter permease [Saprospiraceae bacterium]MCB9329919.1 ABC transporter permease [Lewinellaceae bacterium]
MLTIIAWRNLWRNRTRSLIITTSVALGMWAGTFIMAIYFGMGEARLRIAIDNEVSHIQVHHPGFADDKEAKYNMPMDSLDQVFQQIPAIKAYSLRSVTTGMLATTSGSQGIQVNGVDPAAEQATRGMKDFVQEGDYLDPEKRNRVLVSTKLAQKLKLDIGNKIVLTLLDTANNITAGAFRICGLYHTNNAPLDELNVFVRKSDLDHLIGTAGRAHEAAILLHRDDDLDSVFQKLKQALPQYRIERWQEISPETALVLSSLDTYSLVFIFIILLALSFGIINTMLMAVLERTREIGMLMAVGMNKLKVFGMVVWETIMLAVVGAPVGLLAAWLTTLWLGHTGINLGPVMGESLRDFGYAPVIYPILPWHNVLQTMQLVLITAVVAAIFPALKALRLKPVEAIRT